ncbi:carcinoembryonic antigen-related cell adhesion molecule 20-like [Pseudorasbora parva]|uniref:carcinoembryonic antigen-related cell adhesion molecule 20-like n=1 Tax=Pseudorasbora parva TaxID=51549 RepID=UPI00351E125B
MAAEKAEMLKQYLGQDLQFPEPANRAVGESVVLAPDNPPPTWRISAQWSFNSSLILGVTPGGEPAVDPAYKDRVRIDINTLALELRNLTLDDSGIYKLTLTVSILEILTGETSLQVFEKVSHVSLTGPEESLIEGDSYANISSEGTGTNTSVEWMKDNSPLSPSNRTIFSSDNRSVSISRVQRSDSGEYQCTYRNPVSSETAKLRLIINYGPEEVSIKGPDVVVLGVPVSLFCSANSVPSASFSWMFNAIDTNVNTDTFIIDKANLTDSGDYECTALNSITTRSASKRHALLVHVIGGGGGGEGGGLTTGAIVGIVIGVLVAVAGICGLIVYLTKNKKIPMLNKEQKGQSSGAPAQSRQEPDSNYEEIIDIQKIGGNGAAQVKMSESTVYENFSYEENEYENVKH